MCGFIGKLSYSDFDLDSLEKPNELLVCRGPDSKKSLKGDLSTYFDGDFSLNCSIIFNRLSIIDLSDMANQPMISKTHKTLIVFNGEIYNHNELRKELEAKGLEFTTDHSDTEVALLGLSHFGNEFVTKMVGQFSIVFVNYKEKNISLIRDRLGQKPLFYKNLNGELIFSSNLKSLVSLDGEYNIDKNSLIEYLDLGVVTSPKTIFSNIYKLKPAEIIRFNFENQEINKESKIYWDIESYIDYKKFDTDEFINKLCDAVNLRNISDVPVAHFLSGGIDSTTIIKVQNDLNESANTFSIGYKDDEYDESKWFNKVAEKYNTNHIVEDISGNFSIEDVEASILAFDEPYSDPSTVPSHVLSKKMSKFYKVAVSGDGGDELLGGYVRTMKTFRPKNILLNLFSLLYFLYPSLLGSGNKLISNSRNLLVSYSSYFSDAKLLKMLGVKNKENRVKPFFSNDYDRYKTMQLIEYKLYLSEMMMLKVDRTSMDSSLEVRSPFVDHILIEYILSRDFTYIDEHSPKKILKDFIKSEFDESFLNRKKMGFVFNVKDWVYKNYDYLYSYLESGLIKEYFSIKSIKRLKFFKTRVNALRLWKIYFLEKYIKDVERLINN